jgi:hypothetical protein
MPLADRKEVIDACEPDLAHLVLERGAVAAGKPVLVQPGVHHLVEQRRLDVLGMGRQQRSRELDDRGTVADAAGDRRQTSIVDDAIRGQGAAEVVRVETRVDQLKIRRAWESVCFAAIDECQSQVGTLPSLVPSSHLPARSSQR